MAGFEHLLVSPDCEKYVPFARSLVKKLWATGLAHTSQKYIIDGTTITVKKAGQHNYINIDRLPTSVFSGVVRVANQYPGWNSGYVMKTLEGVGSIRAVRDFKPTADTFKQLLGSKSGYGDWHDEERLYVATQNLIAPPCANNYSPSVDYDTQQKTIQSSMYSGKMAVCVQVLLGVAKTSPYGPSDGGVGVQYDWRWGSTHGIITSPKGVCWLVHITNALGVAVKKLEVTPITRAGEADKKIKEMFGGMPTGALLPTPWANEILAGNILQLITPAGMSAFFNKYRPGAYIGWSFNMGGTEAYNTAWTGVSGDYKRSYLYKIAFSWTNEIPSAVLTEVDSGILGGTPIHLYSGDSTPYTFGEDPNVWHPFGTNVATTGILTVPVGTATKAPAIACHINDALEIIYIEKAAQGDPTNSGQTPIPYGGALAYASTTRFAGRPSVSGTIVGGGGYVSTLIVRQERRGTRPSLFTADYFKEVWTDAFTNRGDWASYAFMPRGTRDGYIFYYPKWQTASTTFTDPTSFSDVYDTASVVSNRTVTGAEWDAFNNPTVPRIRAASGEGISSVNSYTDYPDTLKLVTPHGDVYDVTFKNGLYIGQDNLTELSNFSTYAGSIYTVSGGFCSVRWWMDSATSMFGRKHTTITTGYEQAALGGVAPFTYNGEYKFYGPLFAGITQPTSYTTFSFVGYT